MTHITDEQRDAAIDTLARWCIDSMAEFVEQLNADRGPDEQLSLKTLHDDSYFTTALDGITTEIDNKVADLIDNPPEALHDDQVTEALDAIVDIMSSGQGDMPTEWHAQALSEAVQTVPQDKRYAVMDAVIAFANDTEGWSTTDLQLIASALNVETNIRFTR